MHGPQQNRIGHLDTGYYGTWLIDALQNIVEKKHSVLLHPHWVNSSDFASTEESFGFVGLASSDLKVKINSLKLANDIHLPKDIAYLSRSTGLKVAPVPWNTKEELKLFPTLLADAQQKYGNNESVLQF